MDIPYRGIALTRISFIRARQTSGQLATSRIIGGGLGMNFVTIRLTSARGSGLKYRYLYIDKMVASEIATSLSGTGSQQRSGGII